MPEFKQYTDISASEFLDECVLSDIIEAIDWLVKQGCIKPGQVFGNGKLSLGDKEYLSIVSKLTDPMVRFRLSEEDLCAIQQISDKL
jgi:hypothetical protein